MQSWSPVATKSDTSPVAQLCSVGLKCYVSILQHSGCDKQLSGCMCGNVCTTPVFIRSRQTSILSLSSRKSQPPLITSASSVLRLDGQTGPPGYVPMWWTSPSARTSRNRANVCKDGMSCLLLLKTGALGGLPPLSRCLPVKPVIVQTHRFRSICSRQIIMVTGVHQNQNETLADHV